MRILVIAMIGLSLLACKSKKEVVKEETTKEAIEEVVEVEPEQAETAALNGKKSEFPDNAVARIQRTACFGRCPIYVLTVYEDGTVIYEAERFVPEEGTFKAKVSTDLYQKLLRRAEEASFFEMQSKYDSESVTDLPTTITTLRKDDEVKRIENRYQGPEELNRVEKYFDELYLNLNWSKQQND